MTTARCRRNRRRGSSPIPSDRVSFDRPSLGPAAHPSRGVLSPRDAMPTAVWVVLTFVVLGEMAPGVRDRTRASHIHRAGGSTLAGVRSQLALVNGSRGHSVSRTPASCAVALVPNRTVPEHRWVHLVSASAGSSTAPSLPDVGASFASFQNARCFLRRWRYDSGRPAALPVPAPDAWLAGDAARRQSRPMKVYSLRAR